MVGLSGGSSDIRKKFVRAVCSNSEVWEVDT